jgi:hypothetical protein
MHGRLGAGPAACALAAHPVQPGHSRTQCYRPHSLAIAGVARERVGLHRTCACVQRAYESCRGGRAGAMSGAHRAARAPRAPAATLGCGEVADAWLSAPARAAALRPVRLPGLPLLACGLVYCNAARCTPCRKMHPRVSGRGWSPLGVAERLSNSVSYRPHLAGAGGLPVGCWTAASTQRSLPLLAPGAGVGYITPACSPPCQSAAGSPGRNCSHHRSLQESDAAGADVLSFAPRAPWRKNRVTARCSFQRLQPCELSFSWACWPLRVVGLPLQP